MPNVTKRKFKVGDLIQIPNVTGGVMFVIKVTGEHYRVVPEYYVGSTLVPHDYVDNNMKLVSSIFRKEE